MQSEQDWASRADAGDDTGAAERRKIPGVNGFVDSRGAVYGLDGKQRKVTYSGTMRYKAVRLQGKQYYVHYLVLLAFKGPRPEGKEARHLDRNQYNNTPSNLEWGTRQENMLDAIKHGTHVSLKHKGVGNPNAKLSESNVLEIRLLRKTTTLTCRQIGSRFGLHRDTVQAIVSGKRWGHIKETYDAE